MPYTVNDLSAFVYRDCQKTFRLRKKILSAVLSGPDQGSDSNTTGVVFAHGAANDTNNRLIVAVADGLAGAGFATLRFNFHYKERGRKSPDSESTLVRTWQSAVSHLTKNGRFPVDRIVAVGKSMGGRIASQMVAANQMAVAYSRIRQLERNHLLSFWLILFQRPP